MTPINQYLQEELRLITTDWKGMTHNFVTTFLFESQFPSLYQELQFVRWKVFKEAWNNIPQEQWVHKFINTLDMTPINWYLQVELWLITTDWEGMTLNFLTSFLFESQFPSVYKELQIVRKKIFEEASSLPLEKEKGEWTTPLQKLQGCYNINADEDDDPRKVNITEIEGQ